MKQAALYVMGILYIIAGAWHFIKPQGYLRIMPPWLPAHVPLVYLSGIGEITLGCLLFADNTRTIAAWGIIVLLIAVFPANIQMTINYFQYNNPLKWLTVIRLPLQLLLVWWAWMYTR